VKRFFSYLFFIAIVTISCFSCRKDLLKPKLVQRLETFSSKEDRLNKILFINDSVGFAVGGQRFFNGLILKTEDGGEHWQPIYLPDNGNGIYGITNSPFNELFTIGFSGKMMRSDNEGKDWTMVQTRYEEYKDLFFSTPQWGAAIGGISFQTGYIMYLNAGGEVYRRDSLANELNDIEMKNAKEGYICGYGVVYKTDDSMKTWTLLDVKNDNFTSVQLIENQVWICGYNGSIFYSGDDGAHWQRKRNGNDLTKPRYRLLDIYFTDADHGYACGENGLLIYTDDRGEHWMEYERFTHVHLRNIAHRKDGTLFICGDEGSLFKLQPRQ